VGIDETLETHSSAEQLENETELMMVGCLDGLSSPENTTNTRDREPGEEEEDEDDQHTTTCDEIEVTTDDLNRAMLLSESSMLSPFLGTH